MNMWKVFSHLKMNDGEATMDELRELFPVQGDWVEREIKEGIAEYKFISKVMPHIYRKPKIVR